MFANVRYMQAIICLHSLPWCQWKLQTEISVLSSPLIYSAIVAQVSAKYLQNAGNRRTNMQNYCPEAWHIFYKILNNAKGSQQIFCKFKYKANFFRNYLFYRSCSPAFFSFVSFYPLLVEYVDDVFPLNSELSEEDSAICLLFSWKEVGMLNYCILISNNAGFLLE